MPANSYQKCIQVSLTSGTPKMSSLKRGQENQFRYGHFRVQTAQFSPWIPWQFKIAGQVLSPFLFPSLQYCLSVDLQQVDLNWDVQRSCKNINLVLQWNVKSNNFFAIKWEWILTCPKSPKFLCTIKCSAQSFYNKINCLTPILKFQFIHNFF